MAGAGAGVVSDEGAGASGVAAGVRSRVGAVGVDDGVSSCANAGALNNNRARAERSLEFTVRLVSKRWGSGAG